MIDLRLYLIRIKASVDIVLSLKQLYDVDSNLLDSLYFRLVLFYVSVPFTPLIVETKRTINIVEITRKIFSDEFNEKKPHPNL